MPYPFSPSTERQYEPVRRARRRRYVLPGHWQHVSSRVLQGRYAFENFTPEFVARVKGIIAIACMRYGVALAAFVLLSNHYHAILQSKRSRRVSLWNQYVKAGLARLTHEFHGTRGTVWDGPFRHMNLLTDFAELDAFKYVCSHGVKEKLVFHPSAWPGAHCIDALLTGAPLKGLWLDHDAWRQAKQRDPNARKADYMREVELPLTPLSAGHRSPETWRRICEETINQVMAEHSTPDLPQVYTSTRDHTFIPETTKTSRAHCFDARIDTGVVDRDLLRQAFESRRNAVDASVFAHQVMVARGLESTEPPEGTQWTAVIADALNEEFAEADFPFRSRSGRPRQPSA